MAKAYQFYFNPLPPRRLLGFFWKREKPHWEIFRFSPSWLSFAERKFGSLFLAAEIKESKRKDRLFLKNLTEQMKNKYFQNSEIEPEAAFRKALARANAVWQKHLDLGARLVPGTSLAPVTPDVTAVSLCAITIEKDNMVRFSKSGDIRIMLLRGEEMYDLGQNNQNGKTETTVLKEKIFKNILQGKLSKGDKIFIINKELFDDFQEARIFNFLKDAEKPRQAKKILENFKETIKYFSGAMLFIFINKEKRDSRINLKIPFSFIFSKINKIVLLIATFMILLILGWLLF